VFLRGMLGIDGPRQPREKVSLFRGQLSAAGTTILSDNDLQCGIHDVIRRTLMKVRVLIDGKAMAPAVP